VGRACPNGTHRPRFAGGELSHTVLVRARADDTGTVAAAREVVFVQQRALPAWAFVLTIVLVAAAAVAVTQLPDRVSVARGQYNPGAAAGRELLAHELTHVVQQRGAPVTGEMRVSEPGDALEREAERVARGL